MKIQKTSPGFAHVWLVVVAVLVLLGALGYVGYNSFMKKGNVAQTSSQKADAATADAVCPAGYEFITSKRSTTINTYPQKDGPAVLKLYVNKKLPYSDPKRMCFALVSTGDARGIERPMGISIYVTNDREYDLTTPGQTYAYAAGPAFWKGCRATYPTYGQVKSYNQFNGVYYYASFNVKVKC